MAGEPHVAHLSHSVTGSSVAIVRVRAFCSCGFASRVSEDLRAVVFELGEHAPDVVTSCKCWKG